MAGEIVQIEVQQQDHLSVEVQQMDVLECEVMFEQALQPLSGTPAGTINVYKDGTLTQSIVSSDLDAEDINITI